MIIIWLLIWLLSGTPALTGDALLGLSTWGVVGMICLIVTVFAS